MLGRHFIYARKGVFLGVSKPYRYARKCPMCHLSIHAGKSFKTLQVCQEGFYGTIAMILDSQFQNLIGMLGRHNRGSNSPVFLYCFKTLQVCQEVILGEEETEKRLTFQNLIGMLGRKNNRILLRNTVCVSKPYRYARKWSLS